MVGGFCLLAPSLYDAFARGGRLTLGGLDRVSSASNYVVWVGGVTSVMDILPRKGSRFADWDAF